MAKFIEVGHYLINVDNITHVVLRKLEQDVVVWFGPQNSVDLSGKDASFFLSALKEENSDQLGPLAEIMIRNGE